MLNRRDAMIRLGQLGVGGLALPELLAPRRAVASSGEFRHEPTADACIYVFLWGGPPQQDMWDMKPDAPAGIRSQFGAIGSAVPGISVSDQMPLFARQTDKTCIVRSLSHASNNHEPSVYHMLTGKQNPTLVVPRNQRNRSDFPHVAAVVSKFSPPSNVPAAVTVPRPIGHSGVTYSGTHAGFLGPAFDPLERAAAKDTKEAAAHPLAPFEDLSDLRLTARHGLLKRLEKQDDSLQRDGTPLDTNRDRAMRMLAAPAVRAAFEVDREPPKLRDRYGRNEYGESLLLARRLVEAGVKVVAINWMYIFPNGVVANVWDNHSGLNIHGAKTGYDLLRSPVCLPPLDQGLSALLEDLSDRGLLNRTLVTAAGEFGRTPKVNKDGGRDHWGAAQSVLFAGGGATGGQVIGRTDKQGAYPTDRPVSPEDFLATIHTALGVSPGAELLDRENRPQVAATGTPIRGVLG